MTDEIYKMKKFEDECIKQLIQTKYHRTPHEINLYKLALTHKINPGVAHNNGLAYIGDAILKFVIRDYYCRELNTNDTGILTPILSKMESNITFSGIADELEIPDHMCMSRSQINQPEPISPDMRANAFEAIIGAIYVDYRNEGLEKAIESSRIVLTPYLKKELGRYRINVSDKEQ